VIGITLDGGVISSMKKFMTLSPPSIEATFISDASTSNDTSDAPVTKTRSCPLPCFDVSPAHVE
jgi:hypothetical protein